MQKDENRTAVTLENQGQKIFGILHRPLQAKAAPIIVICPGFGGNKCGKLRLYVRLSQELAKIGIAVLRFDYRGAGDSEGEFHDITLEGEVSDTFKCLEFIEQDPQLDASHIGLLGRSLGGAIAVLTASRYSHIKSLMLWAPVFQGTPWQKMWENFKTQPADQIKQEIMRLIPGPVPNLEFMKQLFKLNLAQELQALKHVPLLHIQGAQDQVVQMEHAQGYAQAREGVPNSRFVQLNKTDHDFSEASDQNLAIQETCQWAQQTLLN